MAIREILEVPDPRLKTVSVPVEPDEFNDELKTLVEDMFETMYDARGIGLAAIQVGVPKRLLVIDLQQPDEDAEPITDDDGVERYPTKNEPRVFVNPVILNPAEEMSTYEEGCLSIPEIYADVTRPREVTVRWIDRVGVAQEDTFDGLWATCVQHEIDHLDGKLFIDYLSPRNRQLITRKMVKLKRDRARDSA